MPTSLALLSAETALFQLIARGGDYYGRCEVQRVRGGWIVTAVESTTFLKVNAASAYQMVNTGNRYWLQPSFLCCRDMQSSSWRHPCTYRISYRLFNSSLSFYKHIHSWSISRCVMNFSYVTSLHVMKSLGVEIVGMSDEYGYGGEL
jgi:hypothetical protein